MNEQQYGFGEAPIKMEGGIADPDAFTWECNCEVCKERYARWKAAFDIQQKQLRGEARTFISKDQNARRT